MRKRRHGGDVVMRNSAETRTSGAEHSSRSSGRRAAILLEIETTRERVWRNKRIKVDSVAWVATVQRLNELRKELKALRRA